MYIVFGIVNIFAFLYFPAVHIITAVVITVPGEVHLVYIREHPSNIPIFNSIMI